MSAEGGGRTGIQLSSFSIKRNGAIVRKFMALWGRGEGRGGERGTGGERI